MEQARGKLDRLVENHLQYSPGVPRRQGCIEIIHIDLPNDDRPMKIDLEHETVKGTEKLRSQVIDQYDPSLERQELISVIQHGIILHGRGLISQWREKTQSYPDELANKMVTHYFIGIGQALLDQLHWPNSQDWFYLYQGLLDIGRRLLLTLLGLNRTWAFTDNPEFKGLKPFAGGLKLQPDHFVDRLGQIHQSDAPTGKTQDI